MLVLLGVAAVLSPQVHILGTNLGKAGYAGYSVACVHDFEAPVCNLTVIGIRSGM